MSETNQRNLTYIVLAVAVFAAAIAAYSAVSAQSSMASVATQTASVADSISSQTTAITKYLAENGENDDEDTSKEPTLTVAGLGSMNLAPDTVSINLGFDTIASTAQEAVQKNSETMNVIIESLSALGLDEKEFKTSYFSVYPQYTYDPEGKEPPKISGYQASNNINIVTKSTDRVPEIIDKTISAGANRVDGPWFSLSTDAQKELRSEVVDKAMKDAEDNAKELLASQGLSIKSMKSVQISFGGYPIAFLEKATAGSVVYGGAVQAQLMAPVPYIPPPPVLPGEQQVTATVLVTYIVG